MPLSKRGTGQKIGCLATQTSSRQPDASTSARSSSSYGERDTVDVADPGKA